ncbi:MAG: transposase [Phycisphaeraceae bacterium JB051]
MICKLREAEVLLGQGQLVADVCKRLEVTKQTYYRWCPQKKQQAVDVLTDRFAVSQK